MKLNAWGGNRHLVGGAWYYDSWVILSRPYDYLHVCVVTSRAGFRVVL